MYATVPKAANTTTIIIVIEVASDESSEALTVITFEISFFSIL